MCNKEVDLRSCMDGFWNSVDFGFENNEFGSCYLFLLRKSP